MLRKAVERETLSPLYGGSTWISNTALWQMRKLKRYLKCRRTLCLGPKNQKIVLLEGQTWLLHGLTGTIKCPEGFILHIRGNFFAKNSRQGIIPVLGPVLRNCILTILFFIVQVRFVKIWALWPGYNVVITQQHSAHLEKCPPLWLQKLSLDLDCCCAVYNPQTVFVVTWADIFPSIPRAAGLLYTIIDPLGL